MSHLVHHSRKEHKKYEFSLVGKKKRYQRNDEGGLYMDFQVATPQSFIPNTSTALSLSIIFEMSRASASSRLEFSRFLESNTIIRQIMTTISFLDKKIPLTYSFYKLYVRGIFLMTYLSLFLGESIYQKEPERNTEE